MKKYVLVFLFLFTVLSQSQDQSKIWKGTHIKIETLTENTFRHISYLQVAGFGKVSCNGLIVKNGNEAVVIDTPVSEEGAKELIQWVKDSLNCSIVAVVPTHFHNDCLASLGVFHKNGIPSYAHNSTIELAQDEGSTLPEHAFNDTLELSFGETHLEIRFMGEGHTKDNIVGYFPSEKVLFGGCLVKTIGAPKGNLEDANVRAWSTTVAKVKAHFPEAIVIVPGHGKPGGLELLDYTIELFQK